MFYDKNYIIIFLKRTTPVRSYLGTIMSNTTLPRVEVEPTYFVVTLDGVDLGTFSAYQIHQMFADEAGILEFDQDFTI